MKDFISKVTFGFIMAQLLPGAVVVFAITCASSSEARESEESFRQAILNVSFQWFGDSLKATCFLLISVAVGMCIHGLNWAILAWLEWVSDKKGWESVRGDLYWHKLPLWLQLIISPVAMIIEVIWLLVAGKLDYVIMRENVPRIDKDKMSQVTFLQDFYLDFGQFYAHMAYVLLTTTICSVICCIRSFELVRLAVAVFLYISTSVFFLLGRIQLGSLFGAEEELVEGRKNPE